MTETLMIGIGGFFGAILRYFLLVPINTFFPMFPLGTMLVNFVGCFCMGILLEIPLANHPHKNFLIYGILGAFTTMSTFAADSLKLLDKGKWLLFLGNTFGMVALCIFAVWVGRVVIIGVKE